MLPEITATEFQTGQSIPSVKIPGRELHLVAVNAKGQRLGHIDLSHVQSVGITSLHLASETRGKALKYMLDITGLPEEEGLSITKKEGARSFRKGEAADFHMAVSKEAAYFLNLDDGKKYTNLHVMLPK